jgi:hypothetical protein
MFQNYKKLSMEILKKIFKILLVLIIMSTFSNCTDIDDFANKIKYEDVITKDSELYKLLDRVTTADPDPINKIVCLDFIYPFKILIYDTNLNIIGDKVLYGDNEFSSFLGGLPVNQSISISYPIKTTLSDGTIFSVNNNTELKIAIDSCSKEDIISYCSGLFGGNGQTKCVWKVPYRENFNNKYTSGVFEAKNDGTIKFSYENLVYTGTWVFVYVNDELQININLEGTTPVAIDWNKSRKVIFNGNEMKIVDLPKSTILYQTCEDTTSYQIGSQGSAGGFVIYDKGFYSLGWRYIEAAPSDIDFFEWGCTNSYIQNTDTTIGKGLINSAKIVNFHDGLLNYYSNPITCSASNNGTVVAKKAFLYSNMNVTDWFLPSEKELDLMYTKLKLQNLGNFSPNAYWSSTEIGVNLVNVKDFNTGINSQNTKIASPNNIKARAIRYF